MAQLHLPVDMSVSVASSLDEGSALAQLAAYMIKPYKLVLRARPGKERSSCYGHGSLSYSIGNPMSRNQAFVAIAPPGFLGHRVLRERGVGVAVHEYRRRLVEQEDGGDQARVST